MLLQSVRLAVNIVAEIAYLSLFLRPRFTRKKTDLILWSGGLLILAAATVLLWAAGYDQLQRWSPLVTILPCVLGTAYLSRDRGWKFLFGLLCAFSYAIIGSCLGLAVLAATGSVTADVIVRAAFYIVSYRYVKQGFVKVYFEMMGQIENWFFLCLLPLSLYGMYRSLTAWTVPLSSGGSNWAALLFAAVIAAVAYEFIVLFFKISKQRLEAQQDKDLLETKVSALRMQMDLVRKSEEQIRILRHDERHRVAMMQMHLENGDLASIRELLDSTDHAIYAADYRKYCENLTVNAVLSLYLEKASREGIEVKTWLDIPDRLAVDALELSTVFANAIENADNACQRSAPSAKRFLHLVCVSDPQFILEISNTNTEPVPFDEEGMPVTKREGHGLGTRSIAAFARKHNAVLDFQQSEGVFRLRILLPKE